MINPSIWTNRKFLRCNDFEKLLYIGLFSIADDYGKLWYDILSIKATIFPLDIVPENKLSGSIKKLHDLNLIVSDEKVIKIHGWNNHQSVPKPQKSCIPEPLPDYYGNDTEPVLNRNGNAAGPVNQGNQSCLSKERNKERKKESSDEFSDLSDKELSLIETKKLFDDNLALFTQAESNLITNLINEGKHLTAYTRIYEKIEKTNTAAN